MQHSTDAPTEEESARMDRIREYGCICCVECGYGRRGRVEVHHIVEGGRRLGHLYTLPLCPGHHQGRFTAHQRSVIRPDRLVSISRGGNAFVQAFDTERVLWEILQAAMGLPAKWPESKILPRRLA